MNTHTPYERRLDRPLPETPELTVAEPTTAADPETAVDALAVHRDPSIAAAEAAPEAESAGRSGRGVAWVRPSEMPTLFGSKVVGRGIDLQAELTRRARRAPGAAISKTSRHITRRSVTRHSIAQPDLGGPNNGGPGITDPEGLGL